MEGGQYPREQPSLGYEFGREEEARATASDLDRRFTEQELTGLRIYRVRWNGNFIIEAAFSTSTPDFRIEDARALLGEAGRPVHPDDLADYKRATLEGAGGLSGWFRRFFSGRRR